MTLRLLGLLLCLAAPMSSAAAVECWTGWGYWVDPWTRGYKGNRLLVATVGSATWTWGEPVTLHVLDPKAGGFDKNAPPIVVYPGRPRFSTQQGLSYVTVTASVHGRADFLTFGLSHIKQLAFGLDRLDRFYRWACGLE